MSHPRPGRGRPNPLWRPQDASYLAVRSTEAGSVKSPLNSLEPLEGQRQSDRPTDDRIHTPPASRRAAREGMARGAVGAHTLARDQRRLLESLLLGGVHSHWSMGLRASNSHQRKMIWH